MVSISVHNEKELQKDNKCKNCLFFDGVSMKCLMKQTTVSRYFSCNNHKREAIK